MTVDFTQLANLGIAGFLAFSFIGAHFYLVQKVIPDMLAQFRAELATERSDNARHIEAIIVRLERIEGVLRGGKS